MVQKGVSELKLNLLMKLWHLGLNGYCVLHRQQPCVSLVKVCASLERVRL